LKTEVLEAGVVGDALFTPDWISDPALRRRSNAGLDKGEARSALARAALFHRLGEIRPRAFENQRDDGKRARRGGMTDFALRIWP
jgi:TnpA family transposase